MSNDEYFGAQRTVSSNDDNRLTNLRVVKSPKMSLRECNLSDYPLDLCNGNEGKKCKKK